MIPEHFLEKGVRVEVPNEDLTRIDDEVNRDAVGLSDFLNIFHLAFSGNKQVEVGLLVRGPLGVAPEDCTTSLENGDDPAKNSGNEGVLLPKADPSVDFSEDAEIPCMVARSQGE